MLSDQKSGRMLLLDLFLIPYIFVSLFFLSHLCLHSLMRVCVCMCARACVCVITKVIYSQISPLVLCSCAVCYALLLSHVWLFATPQTVARQAPLSVGLSRQEHEWVAMPSSRGSSQLRHQTQVSHIAGRFLYHLSHQGSVFLLNAVLFQTCILECGSPVIFKINVL